MFYYEIAQSEGEGTLVKHRAVAVEDDETRTIILSPESMVQTLTEQEYKEWVAEHCGASYF